jgi:hypothetical protein
LFDAAIDSESPAWALAVLEFLGLLDSLLPELAACRGVKQNPYHHLPVFDHILLALGHAERIGDDPESHFSSIRVCGQIRAGKRFLILAALGHDLGKPEVRTEREPGYANFFRHEKASVRIYTKMANRLKRTPPETEFVASLIKDHMLAANLAANVKRGKASEKAIRRFVFRHAGTWPLLLALGLADSMATRGPKADRHLPQIVRDFCPVLIEMEKAINESPKSSLPINGDDLMNAFGLGPGPEVGRLLSLAEAIMDANPDLSKGELIARIKKEGFEKG